VTTFIVWLLAILLVVAGALLVVLMAVLVLAIRHVGDLENQVLGMQYDIGQLAITLDDVGVSLPDDLRELAHHARQGAES
jgi:hypothetical protein